MIISPEESRGVESMKEFPLIVAGLVTSFLTGDVVSGSEIRAESFTAESEEVLMVLWEEETQDPIWRLTRVQHREQEWFGLGESGGKWV